MGKAIDIAGEQYGNLTAVKVDHLGKRNKRYWLCKCACGKYTVQSVGDLRAGKVKSCGCKRYIPLVKRNTTHGESKTRLYHIWRGMKTRCQNPNHGDYIDYGARGIKVCSEWDESYESFRDWAMSHGYSENLTIERNDVNGDYCPENCCWITKNEQAKNKRPRKSLCGRDKKGRFTKSARIIFDNPELPE